MPELESMTITVEEAKRRKAVADMIIAEIAVSEALAGAAPLSDAEEYPFEGVVWHCQHGWLYTVNQLQAAVESATAGGVQKAKLDRILKIDKEVEQDQIAPGTWTTLPEEFDLDADPGYSLRWSRFSRQGHKVDHLMTRTIQHEDTQTVYGRVQGQGLA